MTSGDIPNNAITASTVSAPHQAWYARLFWNTYGANGNDQAWACIVAALNTNQWLKIDLGQMKFVSAIATQGRHIGYYQWVKSYSFSFSKDNTQWTDYIENGVKKVI